MSNHVDTLLWHENLLLVIVNFEFGFCLLTYYVNSLFSQTAKKAERPLYNMIFLMR